MHSHREYHLGVGMPPFPWFSLLNEPNGLAFLLKKLNIVEGRLVQTLFPPELKEKLGHIYKNWVLSRFQNNLQKLKHRLWKRSRFTSLAFNA